MTVSSQPRVVVVTGAARGIGAGVSRELARKGWTVALVGLEGDLLRQNAVDIGGRSVAFEVDVTDREAVTLAVERVRESLGRIDAVVSNAGISHYDLIRCMSPEHFRRVLAVNLDGTFHLMQATVPHLIESRGYFLTISSLAAASAPPGMGAYGASKAAVEALSDTLRGEVSHLGIDVGVAYFSWLKTDLVSQKEALPAYTRMRAGLPALLRKVYPVDIAVDATVNAVLRRHKRVFVPGWLRGMFWARWVVAGMASRYEAAMPEIERLFDQVKCEPSGTDRAPVSDPERSQ